MIRLSDEDADRFGRLATLTKRVANDVLEVHWTPAHLDGIADASYQAWKYFDEHEPFEKLNLYLPSRFRRYILQSVKRSEVTPTVRTRSDPSRPCYPTTKSDASTVVTSKNSSGTTASTSRRATWTSLSTNSTVTMTATARTHPRISRYRTVHSTIMACYRSLRMTAPPAAKPSTISTTPTARR